MLRERCSRTPCWKLISNLSSSTKPRICCERVLKRRSSVRDTFWLGRAHVGNGQMDAAGENLRDAAQRWSDADSDSPEISNLNHLAQSVN